MIYRFSYITIFIFSLINCISCKLSDPNRNLETKNDNKIETTDSKLKFVPDFSGNKENYYLLTPEDEAKFKKDTKQFVNKDSGSEETVSALIDLINAKNKNIDNKDKTNYHNRFSINKIERSSGTNINPKLNLNYIKNDAGILNLMGLDPFNNVLIRVLFYDFISTFYSMLTLIFIRYILYK